MGKKCLRCSYVRQPTDTAPEYECPNCGVVYAKFEASQGIASSPSSQSAKKVSGTNAATAKTSIAIARAEGNSRIQAENATAQTIARVFSALSGFGLLALLAARMMGNFESTPMFYSGMVVLIIINMLSQGPAHWLSDSKHEEGQIDSYEVVYRGGLPEYPKEKAGTITFNLFDDCFQLVPAFTSKDWFSDLTIPYNTVLNLQIVQRQVGTLEGILGGLDSRQLNQANNIHITYRERGGETLILRLEMLTGLSVMGQAKKCLELEDRLRTHGIRGKFCSAPIRESRNESKGDIPTQIEKLAALRDKGIISLDDFNSKKTELLSRI